MSEAVDKALNTPAEMTADGVTVKHRPAKDIIDLENYKAQKTRAAHSSSPFKLFSISTGGI